MSRRYLYILFFVIAMECVPLSYSQQCDNQCPHYRHQDCCSENVTQVYQFKIDKVSCENKTVHFSFNISKTVQYLDKIIVQPMIGDYKFPEKISPWNSINKLVDQGHIDSTIESFDGLMFCVNDYGTCRLYYCPINFDCATTAIPSLNRTGTTTQIVNTTTHRLPPVTTSPNRNQSYVHWIVIIIIAAIALLVVAVGGFFIFSKRGKIFFEKLGGSKNKINYDKEMLEEKKMDRVQPNLANKSSLLQIKLNQQIKLFLVFTNDHAMHQNVIIDFVKFLQADLGFQVYCELFSDQEISLDPVAWVEKCLTAADKVLILWSPGGVQKWNNENIDDNIKNDLFTPVLRRVRNDIFHNVNVGKYCFGYFDYCTKASIPEVFAEPRVYHFKLMKQFDDLYFRLKGIERYLPDGQIDIQNIHVDRYFDRKINKHGFALRKSIEMMCDYIHAHADWYSENKPFISAIKVALKCNLHHEYEIGKLHLKIVPPPSFNESPDTNHNEDQYDVIDEGSSEADHQLSNAVKNPAANDAINCEYENSISVSHSFQSAQPRRVPVESCVSNSIQNGNEPGSTGSQPVIELMFCPAPRACDSGYSTYQNNNVTNAVQLNPQNVYFEKQNTSDQAHFNPAKHPPNNENSPTSGVKTSSNKPIKYDGDKSYLKDTCRSEDSHKPKLQLAPIDNKTAPMDSLMSLNMFSMAK